MGMYFEELAIGSTYLTSSVVLTQDAITGFASEWDPQPFHMDVEAASASFLGELCASGLHTMAVTHRLWFDLGVLEGTAQAGAGLQRVRFHRPVCVGDTLSATVRVRTKRQTRVRDRGIVVLAFQTHNDRGEQVFSMDVILLVRRRDDVNGG